MEIAVLVLLIVVAAGVAFTAWRVGRGQGTVNPAVGAPEDSADDLDVRTVGDAVELYWPGGARLATIRQLPTSGGRGLRLDGPWIRKAVGPVVARAGRMLGGRSQRYRISFPADFIDVVASGGTVDVAFAGGAARALPAAGLAGPTMVVAAGAVALSVAQQQRLDRTLAVIELRIDQVLERMRDDDHGRLDAAEALLGGLDLHAGDLVPAQIRRELAATRVGVDAVYFARRRFAERLGDAIGEAQSASERASGEVETWADGVLEAMGDLSQLRSELLVYLRALVLRARISTATAGILATEGELDAANEMLLATVDDLRRDFYATYRRLRPLARWTPRRGLPWQRKDWERAHAAVVEVYELMAGEVEPVLPTAGSAAVVLDVATDESGEIAEVRLADPSA